MDALIVQPVLDKNYQEVLKKIEKRVPVMLVGYEAEKGETRYDLPPKLVPSHNCLLL